MSDSQAIHDTTKEEMKEEEAVAAPIVAAAEEEEVEETAAAPVEEEEVDEAEAAPAAAATAPTTTVAPAADDDDVIDLSAEALPEMRIKADGEEENEEEKHKYRFEDGFVVDYREPPKISEITSEIDPVDGYRPITWKQCERIFCYERPASGFKLVGDISQKHREHWERSKQIRVRDPEGGEAALFFYDDNDPRPNFEWEDIDIGNTIEIKSPRLHKFMDGQDGMRVEHHSSITRVIKQRFTDDRRLEYGVLNKNNGNKQFQLACAAVEKEETDERVAKEKGVPYKKVSQHMPNSAAKLFDNAVTFYDMAIVHLDRTLFVDDPNDPSTHTVTEAQKAEREKKRQTAREALAACYLNIAASQILLKNWSSVEGPCEKALRVNASKALNAKAYFRSGHALLEQGHLRMAEDKLRRADQFNPNDAKIHELLHRIAMLRFEEQKNEKEMFQMRQRKRQEREAAEEQAMAKLADLSAGRTGAATTSSATSDEKQKDGVVASPDNNNTISSSSTAAVSKMNPNFGIRRSLFGTPQSQLTGVPNFRDLGGLTCNDGKTITKKFMLFRSSNLFDATTGAEGETSNDLRVLTEELGIKTIIDLRNPNEVEVMLEDAKKLRAEGGLAVHMKKERMKENNGKDPEDEDDETGSDEEESEYNESTSGSEGDDEETTARKKAMRDRNRKEKRDKKVADREARRKAKAELKEKRRVVPITGPFTDYQDYFTNIKVICAPTKKSSKKQQQQQQSTASSDFSSPNVASKEKDLNASSTSSPPATPTSSSPSEMQKKSLLRRIFMYVSGGDTKPSVLLDRDAITEYQPRNRVWYRLVSKQKTIACAKREPSLDAESKNNRNASVDDQIQFAFAHRRAILRIDVVTRSFITAASIWVLLGVAFYYLIFQIKKASQLISRHVVEKGPAYMYTLMIDHQGPEIAQIFALASDESNYPIVVTCALGKDRTGVIIALLLAAADVKFEFIARDYAQYTNENLSHRALLEEAEYKNSKSKNGVVVAPLPNPPNNAAAADYLINLHRSMGVVGPEWDLADAKDIKAMFIHLKEKYGGVHAYLASIGVTAEQIQSIRRILTRPLNA